MKKAAIWTEKNRERVWFSVLVNGLLLLFLLLLFRPVYETNDDIGISNLLNGVKGSPDPHVIHCNYVLGLILAGLYQQFGGVAWFAVLQLAVLFCSFVAVCYVVNRRLAGRPALWLSLIVLLYFMYDCCIKIQFTKTAGAASAAGLLLLFYALEQEKVSWRAFGCGLLLACTGYCYRSTQFYAEAALMSGIGVWMLLALCRKASKERLRRLGRYLLGAAVLLAALFALSQINRMAYATEEWQEIRAYNKARAELYDYGFPNYEKNEEAYLALGIDINAYRMIRGWNHMDTEKLSVDTLNQLVELRGPKRFGLWMVKAFLKEVPAGLFAIPCFYCFLLLLLYWLCFGKHSREAVLTLLYAGLVIFVLNFYLYFKGRYLLNRVDVGLWLAVCLVVLWTFQEKKGSFSSRTGLALFLTVLCVVQPSWRKNLRSNTQEPTAEQQEARKVLAKIQEDKEHLYLAKANTLSFTAAYGAFDVIPDGLGDNIYPLGGWPSATPLYRKILEKYGVENPFRDMIGNEAVYLVDQDIAMTMEYIHTYYDADAEASEIMKLGKFTVYQIQGGAGE